MRFLLSHPLNRGRTFSTLGRYLKWQIESRFRDVVTFEWLAGARLMVRHGMTGATGNVYCGLHEFVEMAFLLHLLRPDDLFLDIGANVGSYTVLASKVCGSRSVAFEPDPQAATSLRRNIDANGIGDLVTVEQMALGREPGVIAFTKGLDTMNRVAAASDTSVQMVPVRRLDDIAEAANPTFIKLDVEGFEEQVMDGASRTLAAPSLLAVQSELHNPHVEDVLAHLGFAQAHYDPFKRQLSANPVGFRTTNSLFIRDCETVGRRLVAAPLRQIFSKDI
jgi:FkbM family methyltransferase